MQINEALSTCHPYGIISEIDLDNQWECSVGAVGEKTDQWPTVEERQGLLKKYGTSFKVQEHCKAVANKALELARQISGIEINMGLLEAAGELHDILKITGRNHAQLGAKLIHEEGYPEVGVIISMHHDLPKDAPIEGQLLYLADKVILGTQPVSLEARFAKSREKCNTPEALKAWEKRYKDAVTVVEQYYLHL